MFQPKSNLQIIKSNLSVIFPLTNCQTSPNLTEINRYTSKIYSLINLVAIFFFIELLNLVADVQFFKT